ncbi:MAG: SIR2 family protein [Deltaproteobacteria bacterium]|nr:SIR2 family protein [Deltaproteobacteria bacterium]
MDAQQKPRLQHMHDVLVLLIAEILDQKLRGNAIHHPQLIHSLHECGNLANTSFISLNYDILIDNALIPSRPDHDLDLDYGIDFMNFNGDWKRPRQTKSLRLFKLHGSLNWLYCPTCRATRITPKEKGVCHLKWQPEDCLCSQCETLAVPIIIPPTYFKALSNLYLRQIWHAAEQTLRECSRIIFCGYSFPDADVHVRYLLKRVEVNSGRTPEVFIVNEHGDKRGTARKAEKDRYTRFFRDKSKVHWTSLSFEEFCVNPVSVEESST